jgi:hypothetical protein
MTTPREFHALIVLPDGQVLAAGGETQRRKGPAPGAVHALIDPSAARSGPPPLTEHSRIACALAAVR